MAGQVVMMLMADCYEMLIEMLLMEEERGDVSPAFPHPLLTRMLRTLLSPAHAHRHHRVL